MKRKRSRREERKESEKVDALTAEPLNPGHYVTVHSPDGSMQFFYNISSLIKVAQYRGQWMQPPHFMEPMASELVHKIEEMEGKSFHFGDDSEVSAPSQWESVVHQQEEFDELVSDFYLLTPVEVYVCAYCYQHYLWTRYLSTVPEGKKWSKCLENGEVPPVDPLDVVDHMRTSVELSDNHEPECSLVFIVFRYPKDWKKHMEMHHTHVDGTARDYRLRDFLCTYFSSYNHNNEEQFREQISKGRNPEPQLPMTQQRYWSTNAGYNKYRYNRIVECIDSTVSSNLTSRTAFPNEKVNEQYAQPEEDSDFIDDESESGSFVPRYSPSSSMDDEEDDVDTSSEENVDSSSNSTSTSKPTLHFDARSGRWCNGEDDVARHNLPEEAAYFLQHASQRPVLPTSLYDPIMHKVNVSAGSDDIDFEHMGESLELTKPQARSKVATPPLPMPINKTKPVLLLDDEDDSVANTNVTLTRKLLLDD